MLKLLRRIHVRWRDVAALVALMLLGAAAEMLLPTALAAMIDDGVVAGDRRLVAVFAAGMVGAAAVSAGAGVAAVFFSSRVSTKVGADVRSAVFRKVQSFSEAEMDRFGTASLVTRSTSDVANVQMYVTMLLMIGTLAPLMLVAGLVLSAMTGGRVSAVLAVSVPVLLALAGATLVVVSRLSVRLRSQLDAINHVFLEALEGVRVIRAFRKEGYEAARFARANADYTATAVLQGRVMASLMPLVQLIFGLTTAGVMALGAHYVADGSLEVGALVANAQYIALILGSVMMLSAVVMLYPNAYACAKRINEVLDTEPSIRDGGRPLSERASRGSLAFEGVSFSYPGADGPALQDVSFACEPGTVTGVIGATGSGKTSLLRLVPRLCDASGGRVLVDGMDVRDYRLEDLRSLIGYVPQKSVLFTGDVASNLNFGDEDGGERDWGRALEVACADGFVADKEGGVHAEVAQGGSNFSGGQRQRLAIARAVMKDAEIYLLDDSFSALDLQTDRQLRRNLKERLAGATVVIVAQRVGTIRDADQIVVLDEGRVAGKGTHAELLRTCPIYRETAELQLGEDAVREEMAADEA